MGETSKVVLITGCSTGIGRAAAERLRDAGHTVYASARDISAIEDLGARGMKTLALDVTDEASIVTAVAHVVGDAGRIDVLVNNAGYGLYGPIEQQPMSEIRRQFDTNVIGLIRITQEVLPQMRLQRSGRILNVSSMGGRITLPGGGLYHASKYAVEAVSDALRLELAEFGIDVALIEPGPVRTPWAATAMESGAMEKPNGDGDPYDSFKQRVSSQFAGIEEGPTARLVSDPDDIAKAIAKAVSARRPRTRYLIGPIAKTLVTLHAVLPDRAFDKIVKSA